MADVGDAGERREGVGSPLGEPSPPVQTRCGPPGHCRGPAGALPGILAPITSMSNKITKTRGPKHHSGWINHKRGPGGCRHQGSKDLYQGSKDLYTSAFPASHGTLTPHLWLGEPQGLILGVGQFGP